MPKAMIDELEVTPEIVGNPLQQLMINQAIYYAEQITEEVDGPGHKKTQLGPEILRILARFKELKSCNDLGLSPEQWQTLVSMPVEELGAKLATVL